MFDRETALYCALRPQLGSIAIVSYGGRGELAFTERLPGIDILCNRWGLPSRIYTRLIPWLHASTLGQADVFKSNQTNGAEIALSAARLHHRPLVARSGYMWSEFVAGGAEPQYRLDQVQAIERSVFAQAEAIVVTTSAMRETIVGQYQVPAAKVSVIPNYVCTDIFQPQPKRHEDGLICFAGRLDEQKNPLVLIDALEGLAARLLVIGQGPLQDTIEKRAQAKGVSVEFAGQVEHKMLPHYLNRASVFVLPSRFEGHPKTLLEAMSCGLPVIGTDVPGIREVIKHGETGYLCARGAQSIRQATQALLGDRGLRQRLGESARRYVLENLSLDRIVQIELDTYREVLEETQA